MCSHYEATTAPERYRKHFGVAPPVGAELHDLWPGYAGSFIRRPRPEDHAGDPPERKAMAGVFGLIPHWAKDTTIARRTYNARNETVAEKPSYRDAWRLARRCIIQADAFYEPDWRSGKAVATRISRADGKPMGLAGLWAGWRSPYGSIVRSYSMLTINADDQRPICPGCLTRMSLVSICLLDREVYAGALHQQHHVQGPEAVHDPGSVQQGLEWGCHARNGV